MIWLFGMTVFVSEIYQIIKSGITSELLNCCYIVMLSLFIGSALILAGKEFAKETDSNQIYAYSASVIALISCVVSIIALLKI